MKKKILFLIHALGGGGAEKILLNLVSNMDSAKYEITVATVVDAGIYRDQLPDNIQYKTMFRIPRKRGSKESEDKKFDEEGRGKSGSLLANAGKMKLLLASLYYLLWRIAPTKFLYKKYIQDDYDVEIAFLEGACTKTIGASTNKNAKKIAWIHVDLNNERKSHDFYRSLREEHDTYEKMDEIVAVSRGVKSSFVSLFPDLASRVRVIHNPLDVAAIERLSRERLDGSMFEGLGRPLFLSVGRLCRQKRFDRVLYCAKKLKEKNLSGTFIILGEGPEYETLRKQIDTNDISDRVRILGFVDNPYPYYMIADAFLCTSAAEGFSTTASEAAVLGLPIISTECSGMDEIAEVYDEIDISENSKEDISEHVEVFARQYSNDTRRHGKFITPNYFNTDARVDEIARLIDE